MWNPLTLFFKKKEAKKLAVTTEQKKQTLRTEALKSLIIVCKEKDQQKLIGQLHALLREFFKRYFGIRYAFTNEELIDELTRRKIDKYLKRKTAKILDRVTEARYNKEHTQEEIKALIEDTRQVISLL